MAVVFTASGTASTGGVQQSYALAHTALLEGQLSDIRDNTIGTYVNETNVVIPFGNTVVYVTVAPLLIPQRPLPLLVTLF